MDMHDQLQFRVCLIVMTIYCTNDRLFLRDVSPNRMTALSSCSCNCYDGDDDYKAFVNRLNVDGSGL